MGVVGGGPYHHMTFWPYFLVSRLMMLEGRLTEQEQNVVERYIGFGGREQDSGQY